MKVNKSLRANIALSVLGGTILTLLFALWATDEPLLMLLIFVLLVVFAILSPIGRRS